jgi:hypothetical protein
MVSRSSTPCSAAGRINVRYSSARRHSRASSTGVIGRPACCSGTGPGAVVIEAQEQPGAMTDRGVLTTHLRSDGHTKTSFIVDGGPSSTQTVGHLRMVGRSIPSRGRDDHRRRRGRVQGDRLNG